IAAPARPAGPCGGSRWRRARSRCGCRRRRNWRCERGASAWRNRGWRSGKRDGAEPGRCRRRRGRADSRRRSGHERAEHSAGGSGHGCTAARAWRSPGSQHAAGGCVESSVMIARCVLLRWVAVVATVLLGAGVSVAAPVRPEERVDRVDPVPAQLAAVDVKVRLGHYLPKDLAFRDESGRTVLLGELFDGRTPVILTLNYSNCPMLCSLQLNGLIQGLKQVEWGINREYRIVTVSLEPNEPQDVAQRTLNRYLTQY